MKAESYIGDKNTFAIRYVPGHRIGDSDYYFAFCHLMLGGQIIGDPNELCFLIAWKNSIQRLKDKIKHADSLCHLEFSDKTDNEIFELIWKSNQLKEEFKPKYAYLPVLGNEVWSNCHISIDETTDAYEITMNEDNGRIKFLWKGLRSPCPAHKIGKLFSTTVDKDFVIATMESCIYKIDNEYLSYPIQQEKGNFKIS